MGEDLGGLGVGALAAEVRPRRIGQLRLRDGVAYRAESGQTLTQAMQPVQASGRNSGSVGARLLKSRPAADPGGIRLRAIELVGWQLRLGHAAPIEVQHVVAERSEGGDARCQAASARSLRLERAAVTSMAVSYASAISSRLASTTAVPRLP